MTVKDKINEEHSYKGFPVEILGMKDLTNDTRYWNFIWEINVSQKKLPPQ